MTPNMLYDFIKDQRNMKWELCTRHTTLNILINKLKEISFYMLEATNILNLEQPTPLPPLLAAGAPTELVRRLWKTPDAQDLLFFIPPVEATWNHHQYYHHYPVFWISYCERKRSHLSIQCCYCELLLRILLLKKQYTNTAIGLTLWLCIPAWEWAFFHQPMLPSRYLNTRIKLLLIQSSSIEEQWSALHWLLQQPSSHVERRQGVLEVPLPIKQCSPCKLKGVVQSTRQEQTICTVAEGQAPDLLAVDGDILAALQVDSAHHLNSTAWETKAELVAETSPT